MAADGSLDGASSAGGRIVGLAGCLLHLDKTATYQLPKASRSAARPGRPTRSCGATTRSCGASTRPEPQLAANRFPWESAAALPWQDGVVCWPAAPDQADPPPAKFKARHASDKLRPLCSSSSWRVAATLALALALAADSSPI